MKSSNLLTSSSPQAKIKPRLSCLPVLPLNPELLTASVCSDHKVKETTFLLMSSCHRRNYSKSPTYIRTFKVQLQTFKDANEHLVPARNRNVCHQYQTRVKLQLALRLLLLTTLPPYHPPPPLPPPSVTPLSCSRHASPCMPAVVPYCCTLKVLYCPIKNVLNFLCQFFLMYYLCEKYSKPITVQPHIADCVGCVLRLTLLDVQTHSWNGACLYVGDLQYTKPLRELGHFMFKSAFSTLTKAVRCPILNQNYYVGINI